MYNAMHLPLFLELGKQGEVNPTTHLFDVSGLIAGIPNPIVVIWYQPPSGGAYLPLAEFNLEGSTIGWTPSGADLEHAGSGVAELRVYSNANATEVLRKSNLMGIKVRKAGDSTNPGTSPDWVKDLLELYEAWEAGEIGGATDEQVQRAVEEYLEENPPAPYTLPVATDAVLGGIKAGEGVEVEADGTLNVTVEGGTEVEANPTTTGDEETLTAIKINGVAFDSPQGGSGEGLSDEAKDALMNCFAHVAWTDAHGQDYYDALAEALGYEPTPVQKVLTAISATINNPTIEQGQTYIPDALITAFYSDGTTADVTSEAQFSTVDTSSGGAKTLTVSYTENGVTKTTTSTITVTVPKTLSSITAVLNNPTVEQNQTYTPNATVTAHYSDSTSAVVTSGVSYSTIDTSTTGEKTLTISYTEGGVTKTTTATVTVTAEPVIKTLSSISATKTKTSYTTSESFSTDDVVVTAHYSDGTSANVTASANIGTVDITTAGDKTLNISYTEDGITKTTTIAITVTASGGGRGLIPLNFLDDTKLDFSQNGKIVTGKAGNFADEAFIQVFDGMTYTVTSSGGGGHLVNICYYSTNSQSSSTYLGHEQLAQGATSLVLTLPEGTQYLRIGGYPLSNKDDCTLTES